MGADIMRPLKDLKFGGKMKSKISSMNFCGKEKNKEKSTKINFFKKIYFSVCKIKEYGNLSKEGFKKSVYYIMDLILICSIIYASVLTLKMKDNAKGLQEYLEENFPNLTYENNMITSDAQQRVVLDDNLVVVNFGGQIIIDTVTDYETLIGEYKEMGEPTILLTENKYVTINSQGTVYEYDYSEIINTESEEQTTIGKDYFVSAFSNISYGYYFGIYFISGWIGTFIIIFLYNLLISIVIFIFCKIKKIKVKFREIYSMGLYAHTIAVVGYFIVNFISNYTILVYIELLSLLIPIGYLAYAIYLNKWKMPEGN